MRPERCPEPADLRRLLDPDLREDEEVRLSRHLDNCRRCREFLTSLAETSVYQIAPAPRTEGALRQVMASLKAIPGSAWRTTVDGPDGLLLGLLAPPDDLGRLGRLGQYEVTEVIGRGGMGVVLKAFDPSLHRFVAIKVLAPQLATSMAARIRFAREARAAAAVSHEHVVAIHGVDEANGLPYMVMEYVAGISLQERLDRNGPLELKEILRIGFQTASGLAAAHAQGLVHRDVKPANILLENGMERVKITDFGLARLADDASLTASGSVAGTPPYMAPEQARGEALDHRADLFSLGSVLYAMCTGSPPFLGSSTLGILRRVSEEEPIPVREWNPEVPTWLAAVISTLHAREPVDRFASAREVTDLLGAYLAHLQQPDHVPLPAPPRRPRRHLRLAVPLLLAPFVCLLLLGLAALHLVPIGRPVIAEPVHPVRLRAILGGPHPAIFGTAFTPGSEVLATACDNGGIVFWDLTARTSRTVLSAHSRCASCLAFSPDGRLLASASGIWESPGPGELKLWDAVTGELRHTLIGHMGGVLCVAFSPDGNLLASGGCDGTIRLWDVQTGRIWGTLQGHSAAVRCVAFSPDGRDLASGGFDRTVRLWDVRTCRERRVLDCGDCQVHGLAYSPDGRLLATAENPLGVGDIRPSFNPGLSREGLIHLRDAGTGEVKKTLHGARGGVLSVAFSPDSKTLASGGGRWRAFGEVILWDVAAARERLHLHGHREWVQSVLFSPDGGTLVSAGGTAGSPGEMRLWDLRSSSPAAPVQLRLRRPLPLRFTPPAPPAPAVNRAPAVEAGA
jgi:serine/threonine protein kinase